jgi:hypothetical protein
MANLRILKLITSEEVVGDIVASDNDQIVRMENPCLLGLTYSQNGKAGLNMMPMLMFSEQKVVEFNLSHIIYNVTVAPEIKNKYNEIYGAGIVVPQKSSILT